MPNRVAIIVVVDRLGAGFLGPYGNTWLETPYINSLAVESSLLEFAIVDSPRLDAVYRSYWQGLHAMCDTDDSGQDSLAKLLANNGIDTTLISDELEVQALEMAGDFSRQVKVSPSSTSTAASDVQQTHLAQLFAAAIEQVPTGAEPSLLWVHARAMQGPWDAPSEFRQQFGDEDDPLPPNFVEPPSERLADDVDPDVILGITQAYAGQVAVLDMCLGALSETVTESSNDSEMLLLLTSPRGYPLGEHRRVGSCDEALYGELIHVPWIMRTFGEHFAAGRRNWLVQPSDLYATLLDWFGIKCERNAVSSTSLLPALLDGRSEFRDRACSILDDERTIRTAAWFMREAESRRELFVKPDDRWEVNEVTDRCGDVAEELGEILSDFHHSSQSPQSSSLSPLSNVLLHGIT